MVVRASSPSERSADSLSSPTSRLIASSSWSPRNASPPCTSAVGATVSRPASVGSPGTAAPGSGTRSAGSGTATPRGCSPPPPRRAPRTRGRTSLGPAPPRRPLPRPSAPGGRGCPRARALVRRAPAYPQVPLSAAPRPSDPRLLGAESVDPGRGPPIPRHTPARHPALQTPAGENVPAAPSCRRARAESLVESDRRDQGAHRILASEDEDPSVPEERRGRCTPCGL